MSNRPKNIVLLGATGSIGDSTLKVIRKHSERLKLVGVAAHARYEALAAIAREFHVPHAALGDENAYAEAKASGAFAPTCTLHAGATGLNALAALPEADLVLMAVVGTAGLKPTITAIEHGKTIALASKEVLVKAGQFVMASVRKHNACLLPIDSEHNALFQCLEGHPREDVEKLLLTASGGPFLEYPLEALERIRPEDALCHPNWAMGPKVTVDSSTMANKGLELIEARWLYDIPPERLDVVIHPQSIIHAMVQWRDGSLFAQLSPPCMSFAIQHCLLYPERVKGVHPPLDLSRLVELELRPVEPQRFVCFDLAREALRLGGTAPAVFNAANEVAVDAFLSHALPYLKIPQVIDKTLKAVKLGEPENLDAVIEADQEARCRAHEYAGLPPWKTSSTT